MSNKSDTYKQTSTICAIFKIILQAHFDEIAVIQFIAKGRHISTEFILQAHF